MFSSWACSAVTGVRSSCETFATISRRSRSVEARSSAIVLNACGELPDLVAAGGPDALGVVAVRHRARGRRHLPQRRRHAAREDLGEDERDDDRERQGAGRAERVVQTEPGERAPPSMTVAATSTPSLILMERNRSSGRTSGSAARTAVRACRGVTGTTATTSRRAARTRSRRRARSAPGPAPSLRRSALTWESTVRVPLASTQSHTSASRRSRVWTVRGLDASVTSRSNSVGVRWTGWSPRETRRCARSTTTSPTTIGGSARLAAGGLRRLPCTLGAAQQRLAARDELAHRERLRHVVVRADAQADEHVGLVVARGEHEDGDRALGLDAPAHLEPVDAGEHDVQHDEVRAQPAPRPRPRRCPSPATSTVQPSAARRLATAVAMDGSSSTTSTTAGEADVTAMTPAWHMPAGSPRVAIGPIIGATMSSSSSGRRCVVTTHRAGPSTVVPHVRPRHPVARSTTGSTPVVAHADRLAVHRPGRPAHRGHRGLRRQRVLPGHPRRRDRREGHEARATAAARPSSRRCGTCPPSCPARRSASP